MMRKKEREQKKEYYYLSHRCRCQPIYITNFCLWLKTKVNVSILSIYHPE